MGYEFESQDKLSGIDLTLSIGCRLNCHYCPQKRLVSQYVNNGSNPQDEMSMETFKKVLKNVRIGGSVCFSGMCEPFHNSHCIDMIEYAFQNGYKIMLFTTLMGVTDEIVDRLKKIDIMTLTIHIPDKERNSKFIIDNHYLHILQRVVTELRIDGFSCHGEIDDCVVPIVGTTAPVFTKMMNRAGNLEYEDLETQYCDEALICSAGAVTDDEGAWVPEILPDGTVSLCCMDYGMDHILGNLEKQSWAEIRDGKRYNTVINAMREEPGKTTLLCRRCNGALSLKEMQAREMKKLLQNTDSSEIALELSGILERILAAKQICIFGIGKMFWDRYKERFWDEVFPATMLSDNNSELWGKSFYGITCVSPEELKKHKNLLVVVFVKDGEDIRSQLKGMGVHNIILMKDIYKAMKECKDV